MADKKEKSFRFRDILGRAEKGLEHYVEKHGLETGRVIAFPEPTLNDLQQQIMSHYEKLVANLDAHETICKELQRLQTALREKTEPLLIAPGSSDHELDAQMEAE